MDNVFGLLPRYGHADLKKVHPDTSRQLLDLCDRFDKMTAEEFYDKRPDLYLFGLSRRGKTWVLHAIANKIIHQFGEKSLRYISSPKLMHYFVKFTDNDYGESMVDAIAGKKVLIVDDFGQEYKSDTRFVENRYEEFFRWRFGYEKITMIGSNATVDTIESIFGGSFANFIDGEYLTYEISEGIDLSSHFLEDKWK